ncbi:hypothetical protein LguiB_024231 [Lonicera macranthoides]
MAQNDANCLILNHTSPASQDLSSNILAFLFCQIPQANAKYQHLRNNFDFFLFHKTANPRIINHAMS